MHHHRPLSQLRLLVCICFPPSSGGFVAAHGSCTAFVPCDSPGQRSGFLVHRGPFPALLCCHSSPSRPALPSVAGLTLWAIRTWAPRPQLATPGEHDLGPTASGAPIGPRGPAAGRGWTLTGPWLFRPQDCPGIFSAGLDLTEMCGRDPTHYAEYWKAVQELWLRFYLSHLVVISAINVSVPAPQPPRSLTRGQGRPPEAHRSA